MNVKYLLCICVAVLAAHVASGDMESEHVEESTQSPIADLAMIDSEVSSSTEKPPVAKKDSEEMKSADKPAAQRHTVADFIIHPLIAFKPRVTETDEDTPAGRQAESTSTTPSPWQLFGFNTGQGLGSQVSNSVSSLAGSVTGWLNNQLPGLVDTPVRTSSTTSTTTTIRPDVVVQVQHNRRTTRRPIIRINQNNNNRPNNFNNNRPNRRNQNRPNRFNNNNNYNNNNNNFGFDSQEEDEQEEDDDFFYNNNNNNNSDDYEHEDDDTSNNESNSVEESDDNSNNNANDQSGEEEDDDDAVEEEKPVRKPANNKRRPAQENQQRKRPQNPRKSQPKRRLTATQQYGFIDDDEDNNEPNADDDENAEDVEHFYYEEVRPSTKRSQTQSGFIQRGQQSIINQIRQLAQGLSPSDVASTGQRRPQQNTKRQRQQAAVLINRNGQTFYVAPEIFNSAIPLPNNAPQYQYVKKVVKKPSKLGAFPQPPLTIPLKRKGRPTQYITIPWSQLGISPPNELVSITEGVQSQPLILNIPQNAINTMQNPNRRKNRPVITADAVPLLADASLMDIFKPPRIPPSRTSTTANKVPAGTPVFIASKGGLSQRIRPATIVEKAPAMTESMDKPNESDEATMESMHSSATLTNTNDMQKTDSEYIIVGEDNEPGLTRHVQPVYGDARYVQISGRQPIFELLNRGRFALRKSGRSLEQPESVDTVSLEQQKSINGEQLIPVEIINEANEPQSSKPVDPQPTEATKVVEPAVAEAVSAPVVEQAVIQEEAVSEVEAKVDA